ncbi:MAG: hypothetical protein BroJett026_27600 [Betaproteobacteria bacterium]|nr:MAG: hypothetical protein BroJett026_27600 [Betaproteobacteria bacterium]
MSARPAIAKRLLPHGARQRPRTRRREAPATTSPAATAGSARARTPRTSARRRTFTAVGARAPACAVPDASVWLECSGELIDLRSVQVLGIRLARPGIEVVVFGCPRCGKPHSSLRFA